MLSLSRLPHEAGHILFRFVDLPVIRDGAPGIVSGSIRITFDARGNARPTQVQIAHRDGRGADKVVPISDPLWTAVVRALNRHRWPDIGEAIERVLDEQRPRTRSRRPTPSRARRLSRVSGRAALDRLLSASGVALTTAAELVCIGAFIAGFAVWGTPDLPPGAGPHRTSIAILEPPHRP